MDKTLSQQLKDVCSKIVGQWYCAQLHQYFIFDFNDRPLQMAGLTVINSETFKTEYGVAIDTSEPPSDGVIRFYFDVGKFDKRYYKILSITKDMLVISEFFMIPNSKPVTPVIYVRKTDLNAAGEILKGLSSI